MMALSGASFRKSVGKRGYVGTAKYAVAAALEPLRWRIDSRFDRIHNVDTSGKISLSALEVHSENVALATWYEPSPNSCFKQLLQHLPVDFSRYLFVDYGSGKGRVMFLAADHPFTQVIGVEFSRELHEIAVQNIRTYRSRTQRCRAIESVCMDAVDYELPAQPAVLFFYSPFNAAVLGRIIDRIKGSLCSHPRSVYILYLGTYADNIALLENSGLQCREVRLRRDYLRGVTKRGFILHSGAPEPQ